MPFEAHLTDFCFLERKEGDSNPRYPNRVRQFSKLVVSATHPSFQTSPSLKSSAKVDKKNKYAKYHAVNFSKIFK